MADRITKWLLEQSVTHMAADQYYSPSRLREKQSSRGGSVLLLVLVVVAMLSLAGAMFSKLMSSEYRAARVHGTQLQTQALAESGMRYVETFLAQDTEAIEEDGGFFDNPDRFRGVLVVDGEQPAQRGRFTVLAPAMSGGYSAGVRFGLEDESTRMNLSVLMTAEARVENGGRDLLMALPGMTEEIADAVLDWIDEDDEPRQFGAEIDYYSGLNPPYAPKNGPLSTVEELLLVRAVTPELLFGPDANRNGSVDGGEAGGQVLDEVDNTDGALDRGWSAYLTLHSAEANTRLDGSPKINVNSDDLEQLHTDLVEALGDEDMANYIIAYRQYGPAQGNSGSTSNSMSAGAFDPDFNTEGRVKLSTILDLIGDAGVVVSQQPGGGQSGGSGSQTGSSYSSGGGSPSGGRGGGGGGSAGQKVRLESPFPNGPIAMSTYLPKLMENLSVNPDTSIPGRININQASRTVLLGIPGLDEELVNDILSNRIENPLEDDNESQRYETWLLTEALVTLDEMKALMPFVTARGSIFRAQFVGFFDAPGPSSRVEALIDATTSLPRLLFWRDMGQLGRGYSLELLGAGEQVGFSEP